MNFMDEFIIIFVIISISTTFVDYFVPMVKWLDFKPFNCSFCLSFWMSLFSYVLFDGVAVMVTPLLLRIIERRLL